MKTCSICKAEKPEEDFYKQARTKDGLQGFCKKCDNNRKTLYLRSKSTSDKTPTLIARELRLLGQKRCPGCKVVKSVDSFYPSGASNNGRASHCMVCSLEISKRRPKEEKSASYQKNKEHLRNNHLKRRFGITLEEYRAMEKSQNGVCAICGEKEENKALAVDHCHKTNKVRSLLCGRCNPAIGYLRDDPKLAQLVVKYLERHG